MSELDTYLTLDGQAFIAPQYSIWLDTRRKADWSCPDYVVLDFRHKHVVVVEETKAFRPEKLIGKVIGRGEQWYSRLSAFLVRQNVVSEDWHIRCLLVMRSDIIEKYKSQLKDQLDVSFLTLEDCSFPWKFHDRRMQGGIQGNESVSAKTVGEWASNSEY